MEKLRHLTLTIPLLLLIAGCGSPSPDDRLQKMAERSLDRQAEQNEIIAEQSREVTRNTGEMLDADAQARQDVIELQRELAESEAVARAELIRIQQDLVERDAQGRQELAELRRGTQTTVARERETIDRQREALADERRQIAKERQRAPVIAAAIAQFGLILACLAPLLLAAYLLHVLRHSSDDDAAVTELLVGEIVADRPRLLPRPDSLPALPSTAPPDGGGTAVLPEASDTPADSQVVDHPAGT